MDIGNYDDAARKFYKTLKITQLPVSSWDFYAPNFDTFCDTANDITSLSKIAKENSWVFDSNLFEEELQEKEHVIVVTDAKLNIVYATNNIWKMNGYRPEQLIGNKPNMFQGKETCKKSLEIISTAIKAERSFETTVTNYRQDGTTYNCWIHGQPIFDKTGKVINFIAFEREVA
ncbi:MAG: PAS domain S-box-containing protein [Maribacter sp.]|jgi:PAS domain S-box-containing protein|tara:strand:+ start:98 stop:619 length:522 start_codon:yes stop_codon:yes gene_type:complete